MERVGEDVGRPREDSADHPAEREGDRERRGDPPDGRAAQQVGLDEEDVRRRPDADAEHEPDREREQEAAEAEARLAHRPGAGGDEQRREHAEGDEVAEREVDDAGEPVDERVPDGEDPVHAPGCETGDDHLDDEAHGGTLLR